MKRATRTPNRFITSTQSWPVKGLALFLILLVLGSCEDEVGLIGVRKNSRFGVYFKEFNIPVTTIQGDSIRTSVIESQRLFCGEAVDFNFGKVSSTAFVQFYSDLAYLSPKIDITGKSNFTPTSLTLDLIFDNYVYGDTTDQPLNFNLHSLYENSFPRKEYYSSSSIPFNPDVFASASYMYVHDSIKSYRKKNANPSTQTKRYDTLSFTLPVQTYGKHLLDTATAKGVKRFDSKTSTWVLSNFKTDSVFRYKFPGFALVASPLNGRVMGFNMATSVMTLRFTYVKDGAQFNAVLTYRASDLPSFSSVSYDRTGTPLTGLNVEAKFLDFNAPDAYVYMQSGSGLFAKLDFTELHNYFDANPDTIANMALNAAELIVDAEPQTERKHLEQPSGLNLRVVRLNNRFFEVPNLPNSTFYDPQIAIAYYCASNRKYLDALGEYAINGPVLLKREVELGTNRQIYSSYATEFFQNFLDLPKGYSKIYYMALLPADAPYGKSFHGLSFKKDKVKLRVFYTKTL